MNFKNFFNFLKATAARYIVPSPSPERTPLEEMVWGEAKQAKQICIVFLLCCTLFSFKPYDKFPPKYDYIVAQDGTGDFTNIQSAIEACKSFPYQRIKIYIKNGFYKEKVFIPSWNTKISLIGENEDSTIITFGDYFNKINKGPNSTFYTATVLVQGNDFHAENLTIENSAGPVGQALALAVEADRCFLKNCKFLGNQDTLYVAGEHSRQYFNECYIEGTTDFIFGEATALFEKCVIKCKANSYITAASTPQDVSYGFVFKNCVLTAAPGINKVFLGRPWRKYARTVFINTHMGAFIQSDGWSNWANTDNYKTVLYAEYNSQGHGAIAKKRAQWSLQLSKEQAEKYTIKNIFAGRHGWNPLEQNN